MLSYLFSLCVVLVLTTIYFGIAIYKKDNSIIDRLYGLTFVITAWFMVILQMQTSVISPLTALVLILISIWGIRLSSRIHLKNRRKGVEDFRYATWRKEWMKKGKGYFYVRSYLQIFVLQGVIVSLVLLPFTLIASNPTSFSSALIPIGLLVWVVGFFFESIGDYQVDLFVKHKHSDGEQIMKKGLWKYTRHPNYFGESSMWWGLALVAFSQASILVFISPLLITYLLLKVSGIPMLEKRWHGLPEWEAYKRRTSAFLPLPPKE
jgi:steroid 5-alpha reductase family enzyme